MAWYRGTEKKITNQFLKMYLTIVVSFAAVIGPRSIQQISQFIFLNLNTQPDQFVRAVITQTQSKLKRSNTIVQNVTFNYRTMYD